MLIFFMEKHSHAGVYVEIVILSIDLAEISIFNVGWQC